MNFWLMAVIAMFLVEILTVMVYEWRMKAERNYSEALEEIVEEYRDIFKESAKTVNIQEWIEENQPKIESTK